MPTRSVRRLWSCLNRSRIRRRKDFESSPLPRTRYAPTKSFGGPRRQRGFRWTPDSALFPPPAPLVTELSRLGIVKPDDPAAVLPKTAKPGPRSSPAVTSGGHPLPRSARRLRPQPSIRRSNAIRVFTERVLSSRDGTHFPLGADSGSADQKPATPSFRPFAQPARCDRRCGTDRILASPPLQTRNERAISAKAASHYLGTLMRFLTWLNASSEFDWQKPQRSMTLTVASADYRATMPSAAWSRSTRFRSMNFGY